LARISGGETTSIERNTRRFDNEEPEPKPQATPARLLPWAVRAKEAAREFAHAALVIRHVYTEQGVYHLWVLKRGFLSCKWVWMLRLIPFDTVLGVLYRILAVFDSSCFSS